MNSLCTFMTAWLNASQRSRDGINGTHLQGVNVERFGMSYVLETALLELICTLASVTQAP